MSHRPITRKHFLTALGSLAATSLFLTGCATENSPSGSNSSSKSNGKVKVLASTDVYADIVKQVGGDSVEVSALISSTGTRATTCSSRIWPARITPPRRS